MTHSTRFGARSPGTSTRRAERPTTASDVEHDVETERAHGSSYDEGVDWGKVGVFGAGLAIGLTLGAGVALLLAPISGAEARELIGDRARALGERASDRWGDLRGEMRWLRQRGRRKVRRGVTRSRWAAQDLADRGKRRARRAAH
ncbi:MAG TPA: YtxH domain-containing protein [Gemmatimonadaceae bacterium]|nr:YtxH domain-containing protein [Gemmatimonadaceae bacterium]